MRSSRLTLAAALVLVLASTRVVLAAPSVAVQATAAALSLDLDGEGSASTHIVKVADVALAGAGPQGFTVFVTGDRLSASGGSPISLQFVLVADGAPAPSAADFTTPSGATYSFAGGVAAALSLDLYVQYTPAALQDPGPYSATIDLSIVDN